MKFILPRILGYNLFYLLGWPRLLPLNLVIATSTKCNSRCKTCNIWRQKGQQLSLKELEKTFKNIGPAPYEIILTGGEPFLRQDLVGLCQLACRYLEPKVIIIPTNGLLGEVIGKKTQEILAKCPRVKLVINFSLDGIGKDHDRIRGIPANFKRFQVAYESVQKIDSPRLTVKIHSVISKFNAKKIPQIYQSVQKKFSPEGYITEIAEERVELGTLNAKISPTRKEYAQAVNFLIDELSHSKHPLSTRLTQAFRIEYYRLVKKILKQKKAVLPCLAGIASAQISATGEVWACCMRCESLGNLRDEGYDFKKIYFSQKANQVRQEIKSRGCYCPLANAAYTNLMCHPPSLFRVGLTFLKLSL